MYMLRILNYNFMHTYTYIAGRAEDGYPGDNESEKTLKQKLNKHIQHLQQQYTHNTNNLNTNNTNNSYPSNNNTSILSNDILKMYIDYCKKYCHPVLTRPAAKILQVCYTFSMRELYSS